MAHQTENVIELTDVTTAFGRVVIHEGLDLTVKRGETLALVGASGSGKTTLLRVMIMLMRPVAGSVLILGENALSLSDAEANRLRRNIGVMFQQGALFSGLTVAENVEMPMKEHTGLPARIRKQLALLKITLAGLPAETGSKYPRELSGGMLKRAAVARALALDPALLFLDEPSAGLDPVSANALDELIIHLRESLGLTIVIVTHDLDTLWRVTDRVAFLGEKRLLAVDRMQALSQHPHPMIFAYFSGPRGRAAALEQQWTQK
ncbi:MAG: ABC transporter ATP-binding protein [Methylococcales bacterium]